MIALPDDDELHSNTKALIAEPARTSGSAHRHRLPRLGSRGRGVGAVQPADRGVVLGPDRVSRTESDGRVARRRPARGVVAEVRILTARCWNTCSNPGVSGLTRSPSNCTGRPTPGIRSRNSWADCVPRAPKSCPFGCTGGSQHRWAASSTSWSHWDRPTTIRCGQLHVGTRRGGGAGTQPRPRHRGPAAGSAAH